MTKPLLTFIVAFLEACKAVFWTFPARTFILFWFFGVPAICMIIGLAFWLLILVAVVKVVVWAI